MTQLRTSWSKTQIYSKMLTHESPACGKQCVEESLQEDSGQGRICAYLAIQLSPDQVMSFGGSTAPCAMCFLYSIGKIGEPENKVYFKLLCDLLNKQLKIPSDR
uniref:Macrophage migration inhibitory factor n=1 Tax=Amazona collaria TaxID=241587 RepID=A0A8B9FLZ5_9PSIT